MLALRHRMALAWGFAGALACSSKTQSAPPHALGLDDLVEGLATAACAWQLRCCSPVELSTSTSGRFSTMDDCLPYARLELDKGLGALRASASTGRVVIDPVETMACLEAQRSRGCNAAGIEHPEALSFTPWVAGCASAFQGQIADGRSCSFSEECASGSHCAFASGSFSTADGGSPTFSVLGVEMQTGTCRRIQKRGDPCQADSDCGSADYCQPSDLRCVARLAEGSSCQLSGAVGVQPSACAEGLICDALTGTCRHLPGADESCAEFGTPCDPDPKLALTCVGAGFNGVGICKTNGKQGDACGGDGIPPCGGGLTCNAAPGAIGTCATPPAVGEACRGACASPAICDGATGRCTLPGAKVGGQMCSTNAECASLDCQLGTDFRADASISTSTCGPPIDLAIVCSGASLSTAGPLDGGGEADLIAPPNPDGDEMLDLFEVDRGPHLEPFDAGAPEAGF